MACYQITAQLAEDFSAFLHREERSGSTREKYLHCLARFTAWLGGEAVTRDQVARWKEALLGEGKGPGTVNGYLAAIHSFFRFAGWQDCHVRYLKIQRRAFRDSSRDLERGEYVRLVQAAQNRGRERLALTLETICGTGVRVSEVKFITVEAARRGRAEVSLKGKIRTILIPGKLAKKLLAYARNKKIASGEIFLTESGKSLSRRQIWREMKQLCQAAGVEASKVFPHNLRHLFARSFYTACQDIVRLADVLGHSSLETTRIYLMSTGEEHARQLERLNLVL